jgi:N-acyl-D-amino-acid deacylase
MTTATVVMIALALQPAASKQAATADEFDLIIRQGTVLDGTGAEPFKADVGIIGRHIIRIGDLAALKAKREINAAGLYVAPGFINLHSHASLDALATAENMLTQGVTTELLNPDGGGRTDLDEQLASAASGGLAVNIGAYIGFNSVWTSVVGEADRRPTAEELGRMREIVTANLDRGAWGVSAGLDYKPAYYATAEEVVEVVKAAQPYRTNFPNHDRVTPETKYSSRAGVAETIGIGGRAGLVPVITHMKVQGREQGGATTTLALMRDATNRGNYTAADVYPYLAGQTALGAGWRPRPNARALQGSQDARSHRFGSRRGDDRAIRRSGRCVPSRKPARVGRRHERAECGRRRSGAQTRGNRQPGSDSPVWCGARPHQDSSASNQLNRVRLRCLARLACQQPPA